jgi:hypothetical protein
MKVYTDFGIVYGILKVFNQFTTLHFFNLPDEHAELYTKTCTQVCLKCHALSQIPLLTYPSPIIIIIGFASIQSSFGEIDF